MKPPCGSYISVCQIRYSQNIGKKKKSSNIQHSFSLCKIFSCKQQEQRPKYRHSLTMPPYELRKGCINNKTNSNPKIHNSYPRKVGILATNDCISLLQRKNGFKTRKTNDSQYVMAYRLQLDLHVKEKVESSRTQAPTHSSTIS